MTTISTVIQWKLTESINTFGQSNTMLIREQIVEVFECRTKFSVEQEEDRLWEDVGDEDEEGTHEVGHREALPLHQLQFGLKQSKSNFYFVTWKTVFELFIKSVSNMNSSFYSVYKNGVLTHYHNELNMLNIEFLQILSIIIKCLVSET